MIIYMRYGLRATSKMSRILFLRKTDQVPNGSACLEEETGCIFQCPGRPRQLGFRFASSIEENLVLVLGVVDQA